MATEVSGYLAFVLHAHLPYVRHPEHEYFLEEQWLFQALSESYIPLLRAFRRLVKDQVDFKLSLVLSPTLLAMFDDPLLRRRFDRHLTWLRRLIASETRRTRGDDQRSRLVDHYHRRLTEVEHTWQQIDGDLAQAFAKLQQGGWLDILTCGATHGYLPLLQHQAHAVRAQISVAVADYRRRFGCEPKGIWLPECGFYPGLDALLADAGLRYFVAEAHALHLAVPQACFGTQAPIFSPAGVAVFGRDQQSSAEVWSRESGYPGDPLYRDFYRDIGHDLPMEVLAPFLQPAGLRRATGIKYHRITGATDEKELYCPEQGQRRALEHATDFVRKRQQQLSRFRSQLLTPPLVVAPYDAELFGHWWYEGPLWIEHVLRLFAKQQSSTGLRTTHLRQYLRQHPTHQVAEPAQSSWGEGGFHQYWLNPSTEWVYPLVHQAAAQMIDLARTHQSAEGLIERALNQAARELLLAQASDWTFILRSGTVVEYAEKRIRSHLARHRELRRQILSQQIDVDGLTELEAQDNLFPEIDFRVYA